MIPLYAENILVNAKASYGVPVKTTTSSKDICSVAFKQSNGDINLIIVPDLTKDTVQNTVQINDIPGYTKHSMTIVSGNDYKSDNTAASPYGVTAKVEKISSNYITIPPYSAVSVLLKADGTAASGIGEMEIIQDDMNLEFTDKLYSGHGLNNGDLMSLIILKGNTQYSDASEDDVVAYAQGTLFGSISYFKTKMPLDAPKGIYTAVVGKGNVVHSEVFEYGGATIDVIDDISIKCEDKQITANVTFNSLAKDKTYTISVFYGSKEQLNNENINRAVYMDSFIKDEKTKQIVFDMPEGVLPGEYTLVIGFDNNIVTKSFEYTRPDDKVIVAAVPTNDDGVEVFKKEDCSNVKAILKNTTQNTCNVTGILAYYKDNKLLKVETDDVSLTGAGPNLLNFVGGAEDAELIKLLLWDTDMLSKAYSESFYIK